MINGTIRSQIDQIWLTFHTGGIASPITVIEQMTYLLFIKGLDESQAQMEKKAKVLGRPIEAPIFPEGDFRNPVTKESIPFEELRWSRLKNLEPRAMHERVMSDVFPFIKSLGAEDSAFAIHMRDAIFMIPPEKAGLLAKVVDLLDEIPMEGRDTKGDLYEYMLGKLSQAGDNGQFRTPRHIIQMMVELIEPKPNDIVCDPACGTAGFLVGVAEFFNRDENLHLFNDESFREHFHQGMFHGFDFDSTMLRIGSMNMMLHGVQNPGIENRDALSGTSSDKEEEFSVILANPPFAGSLDYEDCSKDLLQVVKTKKTELLFLALMLRLLKPGGRAAVIVPDGVLFGSSRAHKGLREKLVEEHQLEAVIKLPSGVFRPYAGVATAILVFRKTNTGGTDQVWFYDIQAEGISLDDKRTPLLPEEKLGPLPQEALSEEEHAKNNLPDVLARWKNREAEVDRQRTAQSFFVPKEEIAENDYDLSLSRYKETVYEEVDYDPPKDILNRIAELDEAISEGRKKLEGMV